MFPEKIRVATYLAIAAVLVFFVGSVDAQKRPSTPKKAVQAKKTEKQVRETKKDSKHEAKRDVKKTDKHAKDRVADTKARKDPKKLAESKKALAERRRKEEERRQAILAEQRRREQAAREARERKLAFERGLRNETLANISRDSIEGEDLSIRRAAVDALAGHAGSVVVMEAQTGKVLTIVNQDWAVRTSIRPCSTIKLVTAAAGLNEGVISKVDGSVRNANTRRNLDDAIAFSDNSYFQRVGASLGNEKLVEYGRELGLGQQTGINLAGETAGRLPYNNNNARIYSHGDDTEVSTLQLAVMVAAITNGGNRVLPRLPRNSIEQAKFQTFYKAKVEVPQQTIRRMIPGMMGTAEYGTAHRGVDASLGIAGKTGSCIDKGSWVGLFTSVAPIEKPKYAVAVITRGQGERGKYAAAVAGKVYQALSGNIVRTDRNLAQTEFKLAPKNGVAARPVADEDEDDAAADDVAADTAGRIDGRGVIVVPSAPRVAATDKAASKKLVKTTVNSKPVFSPVVITFPKDQSTQKRERVVEPR
ncbi:MAG: penicillin-binding transpeptidase domain-containing protein [Acidobacteriota bacterium]